MIFGATLIHQFEVDMDYGMRTEHTDLRRFLFTRRPRKEQLMKWLRKNDFQAYRQLVDTEDCAGSWSKVPLITVTK